MARGTADVKLRPIKLAFLIHPDDNESLLKAIEINTLLWGGMYNPIIPTYREMPLTWDDKASESPDFQSIITGYLDNFDPVYVISMGECSDYSIDVGYRKTINHVSDFFTSFEQYKTLNYGISIFEVLDYFFEDEFRFRPRDQREICLPLFDSQFHFFLSSVFGWLSEDFDTFFGEHFAERLEVNQLECSASNYFEFLDHQKLFFLRMTELYIHVNRFGKKCLYFLDADNGLDIMDYWNLRAIGWSVFPVPKQFTQIGETIESIVDFIVRNYQPLGQTAILKSRSIPEDEYQSFLNLFETSEIVSQVWYPRIWNVSATRLDYEENIRCCELTADAVERDLSNTINFKTLPPKFLDYSPKYRFYWHETPCYANEVRWFLHDVNNTPLAEVIPEGGGELAQFISGVGFPEQWHLSKKSLIYLCEHSTGVINVSHPQAEPIFMKWLELKGWTVKLSSAGRIAKQMMQQLGGIRGADILAKEGIIKLLDSMNRSDGKSLLEETVRGRIQAIENQQSIFSKIVGKEILPQLITSRIFQLGMRIQCPVCTQSSWYSIKDADYMLQCPRCLESLSFPFAPKEIKWAYRTIGPFSSSNQSHGAYTVLLTLRFFSMFQYDGSATTPLLSFTAQKNGTDVEADLALFFQESRFLYPKTELIFVECKTFKSFEEEDTKRMLNLGKQFPGAVLVFATLKESLSDDEKRIIKDMVNCNRENKKNKRPFNPIMILTGTELISDAHFTLSWESTTDIRSEFTPKITGVGPRVLLEFCDVTQQVYLDMESSDHISEEQLDEAASFVPF